jgi:hypothetical protein
MALNLSKLTLLASGNGFGLWHYTTTDTEATVNSSGYFDSASHMLTLGDVVFLTANSAGTVPTYGITVINSNTSGVVDVANHTDLNAVDSD